MGDLGIYFLDVGQGDCTFVVPPDGEGDPILFDCADHVVAERFCANHRIRHLECVIASHLDVDHIRGILPFLENLFADRRRVRRLFVGLDRAPRDESNLTALIEKACAWEREPPHPGFVLEAPDRTAAGPKLVAEGVGWRVELLLPFHGTVLEAVAAGDRSSNRCSAVLRVERDGAAVLVGGDAPLGSWERIEAGRRAAAAIRTPHHGGDILEHAGAWTTYDDL